MKLEVTRHCLEAYTILDLFLRLTTARHNIKAHHIREGSQPIAR